MIADYDEASQEAFVEMCRIEGYRLNKGRHEPHHAEMPAAHSG